jgi:hypothetical protein
VKFGICRLSMTRVIQSIHTCRYFNLQLTYNKAARHTESSGKIEDLDQMLPRHRRQTLEILQNRF